MNRLPHLRLLPPLPMRYAVHLPTKDADGEKEEVGTTSSSEIFAKASDSLVSLRDDAHRK